jgi:hypothetical protein
MQRLGVVTAEVGAKKETGQQPVEQTETIESGHNGDPLDGRRLCIPAS